MDVVRRVLLKGASASGLAAAALAAGLLRPQRALAAQWDQNAFRAKSAPDALKQLGIGSVAESKDVVLDTPQIAENGAVVPVEVTSNVPGTKSIAIVIDNNPFPLSAKFAFEEGALPYVKVNVKMGQTSEVRAIAEADGKYYVATRSIKVTIGGCGG